MKIRTTPLVSLPACACLLLTLVACGDDNKTPTGATGTSTTTTTTTLPPAQLIVQGTTLIPVRQVFFADVTTTQSGRIDVTIDYPAGNNVPMWLTDRQCSFTLFDRDSCDYLVKSVEGTGQKTMFASNVAPGTYTLFVANDGPLDADVPYTVTLTPAAGAGSIAVVRVRVRPRR